ncbi:hypothetical protein FCH28_14965 [Streptomyces piniterrae]|uniref:Uncharacterized protein n=1 Tax=Streptomyces piniterrae TaxID=2571125 RepID=A0A4U0NJK0_9ACTN|nr:hypothetical protein [Streptomyces piniterrae]TJZ54427.1 hypothetical protein FCH28_14965 [Streptomyces piniterrae]
MAEMYGVKQLDSENVTPQEDNSVTSDSGVIRKALYSKTGDSPAFLDDPVNVADGSYGAYVNGTTSDQQVKMSWSQAQSWEKMWSVSSTLSVTLGTPSTAPVKAEVELAITASYSSKWSETNTQSGDTTITLKPNTYGWFARSQLRKTITGTWSLTTDRDTTYGGAGQFSVTVPVYADGTDGKKSVLYTCTSDNRTKPKACTETDPHPPV